MFKISAIQDKELQRKYLAECGGEFREGFFAYAMTDYDTGALMAVSQFEISGEEGFISDLRPVPTLSDFEAMFILGRQTMNFIDLCGSHKCRASLTAGDERLLRAIGFKLSGDGYFANLEGMFDGHCDGHAKNLNDNK